MALSHSSFNSKRLKFKALMCTPLVKSRVEFTIRSTLAIAFWISRTICLFLSSLRAKRVEASKDIDPIGFLISCAK